MEALPSSAISKKKAWELGKGKVPVQLFGDFCAHQPSSQLGEIHPNIKGGYVLTDVRSILPKELGDSIEEGIFAFGKKLSGFDRKDAVLSGIESRTSSPVRLVRDQKRPFQTLQAFYPLRRGRGICRRDHFRSHGRNKNRRVDRI